MRNALISLSLLLFLISWIAIPKKTAMPLQFRDLNKNGKMDVYEDSRQPVEARVSDILKQMTLEEKAGLMFINGARINDDGSIEDKPGKGMFAFAPNGKKLMDERKMNHF